MFTSIAQNVPYHVFVIEALLNYEVNEEFDVSKFTNLSANGTVATLNFWRIVALFVLCVYVCFFSIRFVAIKHTHTGGDVGGGEEDIVKIETNRLILITRQCMYNACKSNESITEFVRNKQTAEEKCEWGKKILSATAIHVQTKLHYVTFTNFWYIQIHLKTLWMAVFYLAVRLFLCAMINADDIFRSCIYSSRSLIIINMIILQFFFSSLSYFETVDGNSHAKWWKTRGSFERCI